MDAEEYQGLKTAIVHLGFDADIEWAENLGPPPNAQTFALEAAFVICNSGMKSTVAVPIYVRVRHALEVGDSVHAVFRHIGKAEAIMTIWRDRRTLFDGYLSAADPLSFLEALPWIGPITKYHLAKNFGMEVVKPDRHLVRIAEAYRTTPQKLCERLAKETGDRVVTVDTVLWRAAEQKVWRPHGC